MFAFGFFVGSIRRRTWNALALTAVACAAPVFAQNDPAQVVMRRPAWTAPESFSAIHSVRELRDGSVLVSDSRDRSVSIIASRGTIARTIGSVGSGPREYTIPTYLLALPGDSSLLLDPDARRYLTLAPNGTLVGAHMFPEEMGVGAELVRAVDPRGRLYFPRATMSTATNGEPTVGILRWDRASLRFDSISFVRVPNPRPVNMAITDELKSAAPGLSSLVARRIMPFTAVDDWIVAPSGRVAIVRANPYRIEWVELDGRVSRGAIVEYRPIAVTDVDKRLREPQGPPFTLTYPATKPVFVAGVIVDERDNIWVRRYTEPGATDTPWDVFGANGAHLRTALVPTNKRIVAITARFVYIARTDSDDVQWLEAYAR